MSPVNDSNTKGSKNGNRNEYAMPSSPEPVYRELEPEVNTGGGGPYYSQASGAAGTKETDTKNTISSYPDHNNTKSTPVNETNDPEASNEYSVPDEPRYHKPNINHSKFRTASMEQQTIRADNVSKSVTPDYNINRKINSTKDMSPDHNFSGTTTNPGKGSNTLSSIPIYTIHDGDRDEHDTEYATPTTRLLKKDESNSDKEDANYRHYSAPKHADDEQQENDSDNDPDYYSTPAQNESEQEALVRRPPSGMYAKIKK